MSKYLSSTKKHKKGLIIFFGTIGTIYYGVSYLKSKLNEIRETMQQKRSTQEGLCRFFDDCLERADLTFLNLFEFMKKDINERFNVEDAVERLKGTNMTKEEKLELWNEVKISSFLKLITALYYKVYLSVFMHIQMCLIYRNDLQLGEFEDSELTATNNKYLSLSWWFLNKGYKTLGDSIISSIGKVVSNLSLRTEYSLDELKNLLDLMCNLIKQDLNNNEVEKVLLPQTKTEEIEALFSNGFIEVEYSNLVTPQLNQLILETKDIIESKELKDVINIYVNLLFELYFVELKANIESQNSTENISIPLVKVLSSIEKCTNNFIFNKQNNIKPKQLEAFVAIIYTTFQTE